MTAWTKVEATVLNDFPILKQAAAYASEHLTEQGEYDLLYNNEDPTLLRSKIQSRHSNATVYNLWIQYGPNDNRIGGIAG